MFSKRGFRDLYLVLRFQRQRYRYGRYGFWRHINWRSWLKWKPPFLVGLSAGFSFQDMGLSDDIMEKERDSTLSNHNVNKGWEVLVKQKDLLVVKRERKDTGLNEYCCTGTYRDISARDFIDAQMDLEYRQKWDAHVIKLEVIEEDSDTDTQVIRWIAKYPYPLYPREYVFIRRRHVDERNKCVTIVSSSLEENVYPSSSEYVRVSNYHSVMVVIAHKSFDEKGFDYVLSYHDNPGGNIPKYAYNWIVNSGGPNFLTQVHEAAKQLENARNEEIKQESVSGQGLIEKRLEEKKMEKKVTKESELTDPVDSVLLAKVFPKASGTGEVDESISKKSDRPFQVDEKSELIGDLSKSVNIEFVRQQSRTTNFSQKSDSNVPVIEAESAVGILSTDINSNYISTMNPLEHDPLLVNEISSSTGDSEGFSSPTSRVFFRRRSFSGVSDLLKLVE